MFILSRPNDRFACHQCCARELSLAYETRWKFSMVIWAHNPLRLRQSQHIHRPVSQKRVMPANCEPCLISYCHRDRTVKHSIHACLFAFPQMTQCRAVNRWRRTTRTVDTIRFPPAVPFVRPCSRKAIRFVGGQELVRLDDCISEYIAGFIIWRRAVITPLHCIHRSLLAQLKSDSSWTGCSCHEPGVSS